MNYTMAMDTSYDCQLQQEIPLPNGWAKGSVSKISYYVYTGIFKKPTVAGDLFCFSTPKTKSH